jgi:hypothetical protein
MTLRQAALLAWLLAFASCTREPSATRTAKPDRRDAGSSREDKMSQDKPSPEHIRKLFADAVVCPNRYDCPPLDELHRLVGTPAARAVVSVAFDLMAEGKIRSIDREGKFTQQLVQEWLLELENTGKLDADTAAWCMSQIERALTTADPSLIGGMQLVALNFKLPGAMDWVEKDIVSPGRSLEAACAAGRFLSGYLDDYGRVRRWLDTAGDNGLAAAICSLHHFDHDLFDVERDELPLLVKAAERRDLAPEIAYPLLDHVEIHESDPRFKAIAARLSQHSDEGVRRIAGKLSR